MKNIEEILNQESIDDIIKSLKYKVINVPDWEELKKEYDPKLHEIITNTTKYPDKSIKNDNGDVLRLEPRTRVCIGLQKLAANRMAQFMFTIPVNHVLENTEDTALTQFEAMKRVLKIAKLDVVNIERCQIVSSQCEQATYWYVTETDKEHNKYGFKTKFKLKCSVFSPEKGDALYPLFDETGNMIAFSREFSITESDNKKTVYFETWTDKVMHRWKKSDGEAEWKEDEGYPKSNEIGKIPIIYSYRKQPIWRDGDNGKVEQIERLLSDNGETIAYHAAPILVIKGNLSGAPTKGEANRVFMTSDVSGGAEYVSWQQSPESIKFQFETLMRLYWMELQLLDMSYENIRGIGNVAASALELLFSDAHLKCGTESIIYQDLFEREYNVIKAYLGYMNASWKNSIEELEISPNMTYFIINDEKQKVDVLISANGGHPLISQEKSVELSGLVENPKNEFTIIKAEMLERRQSEAQDLFE